MTGRPVIVGCHGDPDRPGRTVGCALAATAAASHLFLSVTLGRIPSARLGDVPTDRPRFEC